QRAVTLPPLVLLLRTSLRAVLRRLLTLRSALPMAERTALATGILALLAGLAVLARLVLARLILARLLVLALLLVLPAERGTHLVGLGRRGLLRLRGRGLLQLAELVAHLDAATVGRRGVAEPLGRCDAAAQPLRRDVRQRCGRAATAGDLDLEVEQES